MSGDKNSANKANNTRLPSLKEPRDLTLGGIVKRKFVPTIPTPKTKKVNLESQPESSKLDLKTDYKFKGDEKSFKKDFKGRPKTELIQLKSIFDEGPKEEYRKKNESNHRSFSDRDSTSSAIKIESAKARIKLEQNEDNKDVLDRLLKDDFIDDDSNDEENDDNNFNMKKDVKPIVLPFKKEKLTEEVENKLESIFKDQFILVQHPDIFPGYPPTDPTILQDKNQEKKEEKKTLASFSEGPLGKLCIHKSGKMSLKLGNITFDAVLGIPTEFLQEVVMTKIPEGSDTGEMIVLGHVNQKLTLIPNIDSMLDSIHSR